MKRFILQSVLAGGVVLSGLETGRAEDVSVDLSALLNGGNGVLGRAAKNLLGENGGNRLFYFPTEHSPSDPGQFGYRFEDVYFRTADGVKLHGWFLPAAAGDGVKGAKGTVVFSHGNAGALGHHFGFVHWFVLAGYQVFMYDYRGYGKSEGAITREGLHLDVEAAFAYVKTRSEVDSRRLISFGHSLGGAKSLTALGRKKVPGVCAVICFAGFASYQDMAFKVGGKAGAELVSDELSPRDYVGKISPIPLLIVHGKADGVVPFSQGELLYKNAAQPKTMMAIEGGGHQRALFDNDGEYRRKILQWLEQVMKS